MKKSEVDFPRPESSNGTAETVVQPRPAEPDEQTTSPEPEQPQPTSAALPPRGLTMRRVRKLIGLALVIVLLGAGAGLAGALLWPPTYSARAEILYPITEEQPTGFLREDRNLTTQLVLLQGRPVLGPVAAAQDRPVEDLQRNVTVEVLQTSEIIQVEARGPSPEAATGTLQAILDRYFTLSRASNPSELRRFLEGQLADARTAVTEATVRSAQLQGAAAVAPPGDPAAIGAAAAEVDALTQRAGDLQTRVDEVRAIELSGPAARLATPPYVPRNAVTPEPMITTITGGLLGLLVAAGAVALLARRWTRD